MKIYKILYSQEYEDWSYIQQEDSTFLDSQFRGKVMSDINDPINVETVYKGERAERGEKSDIANVGIAPVFTMHAKEMVEDRLKGLVQWIPFKHNVYGICYAMNVITLVDCLDEKRCKIVRKVNNIGDIEKYVMKKKSIEYPLIFKIPYGASLAIYGTESFKEIIEKHEFKGLSFKLIWDSETN